MTEDANTPHSGADGRKAPISRLLLAAAHGDVERARVLLDEDPTLVSATGPHPFWGGAPLALQVAAEWGEMEVVRLLLDRGADVDACPDTYAGWPPLLLAWNRGHHEVVTFLLERGATVDLFAAAALGDVDRVRALLAEDPAMARASRPSQSTALHLASTLDVARVLLDAGADIDARNLYGRTPLHSAAAHGERGREIARLLIDRGAAVDARLACALGDHLRLAALVEADPSRLEEADEDGTLLHVAASHGQAEIARWLLARGLDVNARSGKGHLPLHYAAANGHVAVARVLLDHGADIHARDGEHNAPALAWARFQRRPELIAFLVERGAR